MEHVYFVYVSVAKDSTDYDSTVKIGDIVVYNGSVWKVGEIMDYIDKVTYTLDVIGHSKPIKIKDILQ